MSMVVTFTAILLIALFFKTDFVFAQDFFVGKVLGVDEKKLEITLEPVQSQNLAGTIVQEKNVLVRLAEETKQLNTNLQGGLPGCVVVGEVIRVWGQLEATETNVFVAQDIRGCRRGVCSSDPTGVRARLLKGKKWNQFSSDEEDNKSDNLGFGFGRGNSSNGGNAGGGNGNGGNEGGNGGGGNGGGGGGGGGGK